MLDDSGLREDAGLDFCFQDRRTCQVIAGPTFDVD